MPQLGSGFHIIQQVQRACCTITLPSLPPSAPHSSVSVSEDGNISGPLPDSKFAHSCHHDPNQFAHFGFLCLRAPSCMQIGTSGDDCGYGSPQQNCQHASPAASPRLRAALCYPEAFSLLSPPVQFVRSLFIQMMLLLHLSHRG